MQTKNALGNLHSRYRAVLKKCHLLNSLGSLTVMSMLGLGLMGGMALELTMPAMVEAANLTNNEIIMSNGEDAEANYGTYTISTDNSSDYVYGGRALSTGGYTTLDGGSVKALNNTLTIENGGKIEDAYGGYAFSAGYDNSSGIGGKGGDAEASSNSVTLVTGSVADYVYGGHAWSYAGESDYGEESAVGGSASANRNTAIIETGSDVNDNAYGGYARVVGGYGIHSSSVNGTATANENSLTVRGYVSSFSYAGYAINEGLSATAGGAIANGNELVIDGGIGYFFYGGCAQSYGSYGDNGGAGGSAEANENEVNMSNNSLVNRFLYGGFALSNGPNANAALGGAGGSATANGNIISMVGSRVYDIYGGYSESRAGESKGIDSASSGAVTANNNEITIQQSPSIDGSVYGGYTKSTGGNNASAHASARGGQGGVATANYNKVTIEDSTLYNFNGALVGGYAHSIGGTGPLAGAAGAASASFNQVSVTNGKISAKYIVGGVAIGSDSSRAENNTVTLSGNIDIRNRDSIVAGGLMQDPLSGFVASPYAFDNNVMHFDNYSGTSKIGTMGNFARYDFTLGAQVKNGDTIVRVGQLYLGNGLGAAATKSAEIGTIAVMQGSPLALNDSVILIDYDTVDGVIGNNGGLVQGQQGAFVNFLWRVQQNDTPGVTNITATMTDGKATDSNGTGSGGTGSNTNGAVQISPNDNAKAIVEGVMGGMAQVKTVVDVASGSGAEAAQGSVDAVLKARAEDVGQSGTNAGSAVNAQRSNGMALTTFATVSGGTSRYHTGSHVDVNSLNLVSGLALGLRNDVGNLLLSAFFAGSTGSYFTYNGVENGSDIYGDGRIQSYGFGVLARYDLYTKYGSPYVEASFHHGQVHNEYQSDDVFDPITFETASYESYSNYTSVHFGLGYIWHMSQNSSLDMYAKYFYAYQGANEVNVLGEAFSFDPMHSHRLRLGARYTYAMETSSGSDFSFYGGLAYEHEFDGEAKASIRRIELETPSFAGGTGIAELGMSFSPAAVDGLSFDAGVQGFVGKRDGIMGKLGIRYEF